MVAKKDLVCMQFIRNKLMQSNKTGKIEVVQKSYWNSIPTIFKTDLLNKCGKPRSGSVLQYVFDHLIVYLS